MYIQNSICLVNIRKIIIIFVTFQQSFNFWFNLGTISRPNQTIKEVEVEIRY